MSTNDSREILACRRHVLRREQREGERQRARVNTRRASEDDRQRERVRSRRRRQNFSEESRQVERVRARRRRENYSEKRRQAERDRARMNRQRQREREIQRQRERQQNNDMMTESVVLMSLWPRAINILISNWSRTRKFSQSFKNTSREDRGFSLFSPYALIEIIKLKSASFFGANQFADAAAVLMLTNDDNQKATKAHCWLAFSAQSQRFCLPLLVGLHGSTDTTARKSAIEDEEQMFWKVTLPSTQNFFCKRCLHD